MRRYTVRIPPHVQTYLRHLAPEIKVRIRRALEAIERDPLLGKPLKEPLDGLYSFRVSQYRIVYQIIEKEILVQVIDIAQRKIVYQKVAMALALGSHKTPKK